ncbi:MAG TPA: L-seryl-tRNA(Sec) selenium transferase [Gemmatimonadaceae bacterium]|nr:L-seryl-tRNA(Sec) selenium transferase [Gemmatimonadaceae bacterium]
MTTDPRRNLPSVGALLESEALRAMLAAEPRSLVVGAVRDALEVARRAPDAAPSSEAGWVDAVHHALDDRRRPSLRAVINATGVVLHTNLGRAPLANAARDAVLAVSEGFSNLEYDLDAGGRGSRHSHAVGLLRELTGAEDAIVVNNCAAALVLALDALSRGREAIVSRGELVEIGGSFRVPDIMAKSGAALVEVGTTNRTHLDDYRRALGPETGAILKVHRGNFALAGFVAEVAVRELVPLAREAGVPLLHDLGSGLLLPLDEYGLAGEVTARDALGAGASLVMMSGDKLLGGPQAGIIVGEAALVARLRADPLARALRVDKMTLAALEATLALYRDPSRAVGEIPALAMLTTPVNEVRRRAEAIASALGGPSGVFVRVVDSTATVGGGAFPTARIPSAAVALASGAGTSADALAARLRAASIPVIGRIENDLLLLDIRSVPAAHDGRLIRAVGDALGAPASPAPHPR